MSNDTNDESGNKKETHLPGALVRFTSVSNCGNHEDIYGVGSHSISMHRPDQQYKFVDIGQIHFSNPTPEQLLDAETSPAYSEGNKAHSNIYRRLSKKQAELITRKICEMITAEFPFGIPPDDEIVL